MDILWWHWLVLGLFLVLAELAASGGFYIIFFGLAAIVVGLLESAGLSGPVWTQLLLFSVMSVGSLLLFRTRLLRLMQADPQAPAIDTLVGEIGAAVQALAAGDVGKVELRGTSWSARNVSNLALAAGARCRVVGVEGLLLYVEPEGGR